MADAMSFDKVRPFGNGQFRMAAFMAQWPFLSFPQQNSFLRRSVGLHLQRTQQKVEIAFSKTKS
ncbi:hypothetical protein [Mesorhizobium sp.]|uniref:hypothetical protein n=1 Tax=Mesorhizobium sp. TaxID=1871066 RepID=UPI003BACABA1